MDLLVLLTRFGGDAIALILLYDFFVQPFRFYGMDPLTRFVWGTARWICGPFDSISRRIIRLPDRDLTPLFTLVIVLFCRGLIYTAAAVLNHPNLPVIALSVTLSFQELFTRLLIPSLLFIIYIDIQLARHQETFIGNVLVMVVHDLAKRFVVMIRKLLPSYRPLPVFISIFVILCLFQWVLMVVTLLPFINSQAWEAIPHVLNPPGLKTVDTPLLFLPVVFIQLARTFLFGIFILLLFNMIAGFSGMDPYDRTTILLGLTISPWVTMSRRLFPFARVGVIDFSIGILLFLLWLLMDILARLVEHLG